MKYLIIILLLLSFNVEAKKKYMDKNFEFDITDSVVSLQPSGTYEANFNISNLNAMELTQENIGNTCTANAIRLDTGGATVELCYCKSTDSWVCVPMGAITD